MVMYTEQSFVEAPSQRKYLKIKNWPSPSQLNFLLQLLLILNDNWRNPIMNYQLTDQIMHIYSFMSDDLDVMSPIHYEIYNTGGDDGSVTICRFSPNAFENM